MRWTEFAMACPQFAELVKERMIDPHITLLGTLRADGAPRISAVECDLVGDDLYTGMIWRSVKALDLLRDPRMTMHTLPPGKDNPLGDLKLYGRAVPVEDPDARRRYGDVLYARIQWRPEEPFHCFAVDIESAGFVRFHDGGRDVWRWAAGSRLHTSFRS
jgi:hypothetical protein